MSGFQELALVVSQKATTVTSDESGSLSIVVRNDHLQTYNGLIEQQVAYTSEVASISGNLQSQIDAIVQEGTSIASSGGSIIVSQNGLSFNLEVASAPIQNHNLLEGLEGIGGDGGYWHLSEAQYDDYIGKTEVASISGDLQQQIDAIVIPDVSEFITESEVASISGDLQSQISAITVPTSATFLIDYDNRYVNVTGDTMTGQLTMSGVGIQLDINATPPHQEGRIFYDAESHTLSYYNDNADVKINVGQEEVVRVRNNTGSLIANGKVVCIQGSSGSNPLIVLADNTSPTLAHSTLGVATHDISDNENGYVTVSGLVNGLNTNSFSAAGVVLWLDTNGGLTETEPTAPIHKVKVGYLVRKHITQGSILVAIDTGSDLKDLHDVLVTSATSGDFISWDGEKWVNQYNASDFTLLSETASISGDLQGQISAITVPTSATFLADYDNRYVNVTGDTMTGNLGVGADNGTSAYLKLGANSSTKAHMNLLPFNEALTNPNAGDVWMTASGLNICHAGSFTYPVLHTNVAASTNHIIISSGSNNTTNSTDLTYNKSTGLQITPTAVHNGSKSLVVTSPANNTQTANEEFNDVLFNFSRTATWQTGNIGNQRAFVVTAPTYAFAGESSIASAATVAIEGAPIAGTNATLTNRAALWVQADDMWISSGNLKLRTAGNGIFVKEGTNATMGSATLVAGTKTISTTSVTDNSRIFLTSQEDGGTVGFLRVSSRTAGTSFVITSSSATDTSTVAWIIIEPS